MDKPDLKPMPLDGARILHLEDEVMIALEVESICLDNGAAAVTHISNLEDMARERLEEVDVAVIDLSLRGRSTLPLADEMAQIGIPLIFVSGLDPAVVADRFPDAQFIGKPFESGAVAEAISKALARRRSRGI